MLSINESIYCATHVYFTLFSSQLTNPFLMNVVINHLLFFASSYGAQQSLFEYSDSQTLRLVVRPDLKSYLHELDTSHENC